jgi:hypothetical protein
MKRHFSLLIFYLIPIFAIYGQKGKIHYVPPPIKVIKNEKKLDEDLQVKPDLMEACGFYGGTKKLQIYLENGIDSTMLQDGTISIGYKIDSLGYIILAAVKITHETCEECNNYFLEKIKDVKKWVPNCFYSYKTKNIVCREGIGWIDIIIKNKKLTVKTQ